MDDASAAEPSGRSDSKLGEGLLEKFAPGTQRNLHIGRGDPGTHRGTGAQLAAVTNTTFREANADELMAAHDAAGGGAAGTQAAEDLLAQGEHILTDAEIILGPNADGEDKLHEVGHLEQALNDPHGFIADTEEAENAPTIQEYEESDSEKYADAFAEFAKKKDDPIKE